MYSFLPSAEERIQRALFHDGAHAFSLEFRRNAPGKDTEQLWNIDDSVPSDEGFVKVNTR
jgi:hypothetical protein